MRAIVAAVDVRTVAQRPRPRQLDIEPGETGESEPNAAALQAITSRLARQRVVDPQRRRVDETEQAQIFDPRSRHERRRVKLQAQARAEIAEPLGLQIATNRARTAGAELLVADQRRAGILPGRTRHESRFAE